MSEPTAADRQTEAIAAFREKHIAICVSCREKTLNERYSAFVADLNALVAQARAEGHAAGRREMREEADAPLQEVPEGPWQAFAWFINQCASGFGAELLAQGKTDTEARNAVIGCFLQMAAGEACRVARKEGREPDSEKWRAATIGAFDRAIVYTASALPDHPETNKQSIRPRPERGVTPADGEGEGRGNRPTHPETKDKGQ